MANHKNSTFLLFFKIKCYVIEINILIVEIQLLQIRMIIFYIFNVILHPQIMNLNYMLHFAERENPFACQ